MSLPDTIKIEVMGEVGRTSAESYASKIRAAMRDGIVQIELALTPDCLIRSAEFLAFLHAVHSYVKTAGGGLTISGATGATLDLLSIVRIGATIVAEERQQGKQA